MPDHPDPFRDARIESGIENVHCDGEDIQMILRLKDVRKACKDWETFSSDNPFMVVLRSEENVRTVRQLPIETDPPEHTEYRALVEPLFRKPVEKTYIADMEALVDEMVATAIEAGEIEAVQEFALPLQCRALTRLLGLPESEATEWLNWGTHIFHDGENAGAVVETYTAAQFDRAAKQPGDDFFSLLNAAEFRGRKLTFEEKQGFANVAFAGGRDTVINVVASIIAYLGEHPEALDFLRAEDQRIIAATEEFVRYVSPLTAISRKCPHATAVADHSIPAESRVALCWPSANRDERFFPNADDVVLDRSPNPHIGFGYGIHNCLGAPHARLVIRSLFRALCDQVERIALLSSVPKVEEESSFVRHVGYDSVNVQFKGKS